MLVWFTENPLFPCSIGILLTIALIGLAFSSGEMLMLKIGLAVAALTALLVIVEVLIVTDKEQIENSLHDMADAMHNNDIDHALSYLKTPELVARARAKMPGNPTCHLCRITGINEIEVAKDGQSATADFVAFAKASNDRVPNPTAVQAHVKLFFEKQSESWKVVDFEASNPRAGLAP